MVQTPAAQPLTLTLEGQSLDAAWLIPQSPRAQMVLAHGAGAGFDHHNMQSIAEAFADAGIATLRFNFPYMQAGKRRVDRPEVAIAAIVEAVALARATHELPLLAGGHSFGGRMTSVAAAEHGLACEALIFCSFPLHQPKKPAVKRAEHLPRITQPMLFLSGTRDGLADQTLLGNVVEGLRKTNPLTRACWLETANHSYVVLKRTRKNPQTVFEEMGEALSIFLTDVLES